LRTLDDADATITWVPTGSPREFTVVTYTWTIFTAMRALVVVFAPLVWYRIA